MRTNGLTAPSCPVSSPQSAAAAGALSGSARRPTRRACSAARRSSSSSSSASASARSARASASRACASLARASSASRRASSWARATASESTRGVQHAGRRRRRCRDRSGHHGRDRRRHQGRGAPLRGQGQFLAGRLRAGAGQGDGTTGDGDGRRSRQPHAAQHGRGHGYTDGGCVRRMACAVPSRTPDQREREGQERAAASGGAMPSHDQPSGLDDDGWTSGSGGPAGGESRVHSVTVSS